MGDGRKPAPAAIPVLYADPHHAPPVVGDAPAAEDV